MRKADFFGLGRLGRNASWLIGGQVIAKSIGLGYFIYLARRLGLAEFGWYTAALAYAALLLPLVEFGFDRVILRDGSRNPERIGVLVINALVSRGLLAAGVGAGFWLLALGFGYPAVMTRLLFLVALGLFPRLISLTLEAGFQSQEKMWVSAASLVLTSILSPLVGIFLLWQGRGIVGVMTGVVIAQTASALFTTGLAWQAGWFGKRALVSRAMIKALVSQAWPFALLGGLSLLTFRIDAVLLSKLVLPSDLGLYNAAYKLVEIGVLVPAMVSLAVFPEFSRLVLKDKVRLKTVYRQAVLVLGALATAGALAVTFGAGPLINLLFGSRYLPAAPTMIVLAWALVVIFINAPPAPVIQSSEYLISYLPVAAGLLLINLALNLWWIPLLGILGAALATLGTELVALVINNLFVWRVIKTLPVET